MDIRIEKVQRHELSEILALQKIAYQKEAKRHNNFQIQPLTQTLDELLSEFDGTLFFKAVVNSQIVGAKRGKITGNTCHLG